MKAILIEGLSKQYHLGEIGTGTLSKDLNRWWARVRGKEDPYLKIGEVNDRATRGNSDFVWALKDINFEVEQGEVLGIIGKNGAGKSTLLKILSKVTGPTTGYVKAKGRIASLLEVGTGFHPELTGRENIYLNGTILGMTRREVTRKLDEIVDFAGVARYLDTPVKRYSSGMKVRLGFAVAAHLEPDILIVDEVLAVGDAEFQKKAIGKMQEVSTEGGRTVLFVSHNMGSIKALCQKVLVIQNGLVDFIGNVNQGIAKYLKLDNPEIDLSLATPEYEVDYFKVESIMLQQTHSGANNGTILTGETARLVIRYSCNPSLDLDLVVRCTIESKELGTVAVLNNFHSGAILNPQFSRGEIICALDKVALRPATFNISIRIMNHRVKVYENQHALTFHTIEGDFFKTGKYPNLKTLIHIPHVWEVYERL